MTELLRAAGIEMRYGATHALKGVDFVVETGKVAVLIGENGAGKSTLMRIIAGVETPTGGELLLDGEPVRLGSVREAARAGIGMVHQELNLCPNLTVAENIFLAHGPQGETALLDKAAERAAARDLLARLGQSIDPDRPVGALSIGEQQIVEIAKALAEKCRILIFDEPTSALSEAEVEILFKVIADLKAGGVGVVYISHRLEELLRVGDTVTILRDGRIVAHRNAAEASVNWIVEQMLGEEGQLGRIAAHRVEGPPVLSIEHVSRARDAGSAALDDVSLSIGTGAVVAIYGLLGSGRTELLETAFGARRPGAGRVLLRGEDVTRLSIADRAVRGVHFVSEDRKAQGLFANLSVRGNMALSDLARYATRGLLSQVREEREVGAMIARLGVKTASAEAAIGSLSGGNQQKALIGRALLPGPAALLLDEPSRGVDVGARAEIFATIAQLADDGLAVVLTTSDVIEALAVADRIVVMSGGRVTLDMPAAQATETMLIRAANAQAGAVPEITG